MTTQRLIETAEGAVATTNQEESTPFDWEELERLMGEVEQEPIEYERLAFALGRILQWVVSGNPGRAGSQQRRKIITARILALCWATDPNLFDGRPSLRALAKSYGIHKSTVSFNASGRQRALHAQPRADRDTEPYV